MSLFLQSDIPTECTMNVWTSLKNSHITLTFKKRENVKKLKSEKEKEHGKRKEKEIRRDPVLPELTNFQLWNQITDSLSIFI